MINELKVTDFFNFNVTLRRIKELMSEMIYLLKCFCKDPEKFLCFKHSDITFYSHPT